MLILKTTDVMDSVESAKVQTILPVQVDLSDLVADPNQHLEQMKAEMDAKIMDSESKIKDSESKRENRLPVWEYITNMVC